MGGGGGMQHSPRAYGQEDDLTMVDMDEVVPAGPGRGVPAAAPPPAAPPPPVFGELLLQCDDSTWSVRAEAFRSVQTFCSPEGTMDVLRHLEALMGRFLEHANDAHHRVSQAALETLAMYIEYFADNLEGYLARLAPKVFLKISDSKESTRDAAVAVLEAIRARYSSDVLLPVLIKTLENSSGKVRLGCIDFLHYLLQHCEHDVRPYFESQVHMKACVGRLTPLVVDKNASLRKLSAKSLTALHRINTQNFLGALVGLALAQQTQAKKAMVSHVPDLDAELAAYTRAGPRGGSAAPVVRIDKPPPISMDNAPRLTSASEAEDDGLVDAIDGSPGSVSSPHSPNGLLYDTGRGVESPPIGSPVAAQDEPRDDVYRRAIGGGAEYADYEAETQLGPPPNGAGGRPSYPPSPESPQHRDPSPVHVAAAPAPAPVVAVVRRASSGSTGSAGAGGGTVLAPREDSGEQWGELIPPLLTALSASSGAGPEERRRALSQLGSLSRRATPTLWSKYFGQLLLLVLEALKDHDAPTREAVRAISVLFVLLSYILASCC